MLGASLAALLFLLNPGKIFQRTALAQTTSGIQIEAQAGFDGLCKDGDWIPVKVTVENQAESLETSLQIQTSNLNSPSTLFSQPISLPSGSRKETFLYIRSDTYLTEIKVQLVANRQVIAQTAAPVTCITDNDRLFGVLSSNPSSFNGLADLDPAAGRASVARLSAADLPDRAPAWQALDYLILSDVDTGDLTTRQVDALDGWVAGGGVLLVTGGPNWQPTAAGIANLLPYRPDQTLTASSLFDLPSGAILASGELAPGAEILIAQDGMPILIRAQHGSGTVYYLTADPSLEPLKSWDGMLRLYEQIVSTESNLPVWADGFQSWDSAGNAVSTLPELALPPFNLLCGFLLLYVATLGPVNYLVLRRLKRKELAWITIPVMVVAFSLLAFLVGSRGRGKEPVISRLAIVQVWPDTQQARVSGLLGIFSPNRATYDLEIDRNFLPHPLPNNPNMVPAGGWLFEETPDENTQIPEMRVDVAGINALALEGQMQSPAIRGDVTIQLTGQGISLEGEIQNQSDLALQGAVLLSPGDTWQIGDFNPGDSQQFQISLSDNDRASFQPIAPPTNYPIGPGYLPPYPYTSSDSLTIDLLGSGDYYRDQETYRRFNLLNALAGYSNPRGRGGGIYLAGWSTASPLSVQLNGQPFRNSDTTLYVIALQPSISQANGPLALTPGLFTWSVLDAGNGASNPTPYDGYLESGAFSLQYVLSQPIPYAKVKQLTMHLQSYDRQGPTGFNQYLWEFARDDWVSLPDLAWGDTVIADPERFIGTNGEIRLRLEQPINGAYLPIERADFTLEVYP